MVPRRLLKGFLGGLKRVSNKTCLPLSPVLVSEFLDVTPEHRSEGTGFG